MQLPTGERLAPEPSSALILSGAVSKTPEELANIVSLFASSDEWLDRVRLRAELAGVNGCTKVPTMTFG